MCCDFRSGALAAGAALPRRVHFIHFYQGTRSRFVAVAAYLA